MALLLSKRYIFEGQKIWPEGDSINLNLENWKPIGRLHDWELWFRVNVKDASEPFKIAVGSASWDSYDWDVSVDWGSPVRYQWAPSETSIELPMSEGKHYVKVTPHNWVAAG